MKRINSSESKAEKGKGFTNGHFGDSNYPLLITSLALKLVCTQNW